MSQGGWEKEKEGAGGGGTMYCSYFYWDTQREPVKEGTMTLKYRSKSFFLGKKRERLKKFQFVNKPSFKLGNVS